MKQFLKLTMAILCVGSFVQTTGAFASVTANCPDSDLLKELNVADLKRGIVDSQGINWIIDTGHLDAQGNRSSETVPASFSSWETAEGLFQQRNGEDAQSYTPYLNCSVGNFHVAGFLPVGPYQTCSLEGNTLEQDKYYQCKDAKSCALVCS